MSLLALIIVSFASLFSACKKDASSLANSGSKKIIVDRVSSQGVISTDSTITTARLGTLLRVDGDGFSTIKQFYINGVKINVNPGYVTEKHIIFQIPTTLPFGNDIKDTTIRNYIRIVTKYDDYKFKFTVQGKSPLVSSVSHTLPRVGEVIQVYGQNLRDLTSLVFPGDITLSSSQFTINEDYTIITCAVPAGATNTVGSIKVIGDNGSANSPYFMNMKNGVFIEKFTNDPSSPGASPCNSRPYNYGTNISGISSVLLPTTGNAPKNPEFYRQVPIAAANVTVESNVGGFDFFSCSSLIAAMSKSNGAITPTTSINNLAIQFDIYIPVSWSSGFIRLDMSNGDTKYRYDYAPWALGAGKIAPVVMNGWTTVTIPLSIYSGLTGGKNYQQFIDLMSGKGGSIRFINGTFKDVGGTSYAPSVINNFQYSFGNFRVVTYYKPAV